MKIKEWFGKFDRNWWTNIIILVVIVGISAILLHGNSKPKRSYDELFININSGWIDANGEELDIRSLKLSNMSGGKARLTYYVGDINLENKRFCTKSIDTHFDVWADGEHIYSYYPELPDIMGVSYGMYMHEIPVPVGTKELTVELVPIFSDTPPILTEAMIIDPGMYMGEIFLHGIPGFSICLLMFALGIVMIIIGITGSKRSNFVTLGTFAVLVSLWSVNDTLVLQVLTQNPALIRMINYISLILLPYPPVLFISKLTKNKKVWMLNVLYALVGLNFAITIVFSSMKIRDYFYMVKVSQFAIVVALVMALYLIAKAILHKELEKRLLWTLVIAGGFVILGAGIDLLRYRLSSSVILGSSLYTRMGAFMFLVVVGLYLIQEYNHKMIESNRAEVMAKLAYTDALTGLKNRLAFNEKEIQLKSAADDCMIVQLDINNLKTVNDVYGHAEGDKHIINAAGIIEKSFTGKGDCFRTGGDEFITVISASCDEKIVRHALEKMKELVEKYNKHEKPPVPLAIAYGFAACEDTSEKLEETEQLADKRMYECKKKMKQQK